MRRRLARGRPRGRLGLVAALALGSATCTGDAPPRARAQIIGAMSEVVGGPHAIGRIGDFLLENDQIRLVIADKGPGRVNTVYGGSLVDADLVRGASTGGQGNDQLAELLPGFVFEVINPTEVRVDADGSDGKDARVVVRGVGGDIFQEISLLNTGLLYPSGLELQQTYKLSPGKRYVEIETKITNTSTGAHPLPYLDPSQLKNLGLPLPQVQNLQLSVPLGQLPLFGGEQDLFAPGVAGFNVRFAIEDSYALGKGFPAFPGMVVDFLATRGKGVSYGLTVPAADSNYVGTFKSLYASQNVTPYSMLIPFTYAGVAGVYQASPPPVLLAGEHFAFTSYFVVGKGDVASIADAIYDLRGQPTGIFAGRVQDAESSAPLAHASVIVLDAAGGIVDQIETEANGGFAAHLPPGDYQYRIVADDRLTTAPAPISVAVGATASALVEVPPPARLVVSTVDELGRRAPVKITLVGHDPRLGQPDPAHPGRLADPRTFLYSFALGERRRPTGFDGTDRYIEGAWWTKDGLLSATVRPGAYDLIISRGPEYEEHVEKLDLQPGAFAQAQVQLVRAFASDGWIAGDFHIHGAPSTDSGLALDKRVISCAAEGLEVAVATDHNFITDYSPVIAEQGLSAWLLGISGMELTTFEMGHFNGYPLKVDPGSTRGGEFKWGGQSPSVLFDQLRNQLAVDPGKGIVQVNHPRQPVLGYFAQFFIDAATGQPYTPTGLLGLFAPYGDEFHADKYVGDFDAVELVTGRRIEDAHTFIAPDPLPPGPFPDPQPVAGQVVVGKDGRPSYPGVVETWFTLLDHGQRPTGMGTSDSHGLLGEEPGYARTMLFVGAGKDTVGGFGVADVIDAIKHQRAIVTYGPLLELTIKDKMIGDTVVAGPSVDVHVRVRAPSWARPTTIVLYANSAQVATKDVPAGAGPLDFDTTMTITLPADAWVVAEAVGTDSMFPVLTATEFPGLDATVIIRSLSTGLDLSSLPLTASLKPSPTHVSAPYAITNPIWVDVDGNGWTAPKPPLAQRPAPAGAPREAPDVRAQFHALPEFSP